MWCSASTIAASLRCASARDRRGLAGHHVVHEHLVDPPWSRFRGHWSEPDAAPAPRQGQRSRRARAISADAPRRRRRARFEACPTSRRAAEDRPDPGLPARRPRDRAAWHPRAARERGRHRRRRRVRARPRRRPAASRRCVPTSPSSTAGCRTGPASTCAGRSARSDPEIAALILTSYDDDEALFSAIMAGASGYILKQVGGNDFVDTRASGGRRPVDARPGGHRPGPGAGAHRAPCRPGARAADRPRSCGSSS